MALTTMYDVEGVVGSIYDDSLTGDANANELTGGLGTDNLTGGGGEDTFIFADDWGNDTIFDFEEGLDILDVSTVSGLTTYTQFGHSEAGGNTTLTYGGDSIILIGTYYADLSNADFMF